MRRLVLIIFALVMGFGWQACDYGMAPGEDGQYGVEAPSGSRSSGLVVPATGHQAGQQPAASTGQEGQQDNSGNANPDTNKSSYKSGIGTIVSPLRVNKGTRAHGDPKTW